MFKTNSLILIFMMFISTQLFAATFSWVDEDGVTHYSQTKPAKGDYLIVDSKKTYPVEKSETSPTVPAANSENSNNSNSNTASNSANMIDQSTCERVESELSMLQNTSRIKLETEGGHKILSAEERQEKIDERVEWLENNCN